MGNQLLLLQDVDNLGRSGDIVSVKPGYARNFLLPQGKAVVADPRTLRLQAKLKEVRAQQAAVDRRASEDLVAKHAGIELSITVRVDQEGHLYGSVSAIDIVRLFEQQGITIEKKHVVLPHPLKTLGQHRLQLRLKEGVPMDFVLNVDSDIPLPKHVKKEPETRTSESKE